MDVWTVDGDEMATTCDDYIARGEYGRIKGCLEELLDGEDYEDVPYEVQRRYNYLATRLDAAKKRKRGQIEDARRLEDNAERLVELILEGDGVA